MVLKKEICRQAQQAYFAVKLLPTCISYLWCWKRQSAHIHNEHILQSSFCQLKSYTSIFYSWCWKGKSANIHKHTLQSSFCQLFIVSLICGAEKDNLQTYTTSTLSSQAFANLSLVCSSEIEKENLLTVTSTLCNQAFANLSLVCGAEKENLLTSTPSTLCSQANIYSLFWGAEIHHKHIHHKHTLQSSQYLFLILRCWNTPQAHFAVKPISIPYSEVLKYTTSTFCSQANINSLFWGAEIHHKHILQSSYWQLIPSSICFFFHLLLTSSGHIHHFDFTLSVLLCHQSWGLPFLIRGGPGTFNRCTSLSACSAHKGAASSGKSAQKDLEGPKKGISLTPPPPPTFNMYINLRACTAVQTKVQSAVASLPKCALGRTEKWRFIPAR